MTTRQLAQAKAIIAEIGKIDPKKNYSLAYTSNDIPEDDEELNQIKQFLPELKIRGDIVYRLHRCGYPNNYVLKCLSSCEPNYCMATYYLFE
jgi:hypothetical protein